MNYIVCRVPFFILLFSNRLRIEIFLTYIDGRFPPAFAYDISHAKQNLLDDPARTTRANVFWSFVECLGGGSVVCLAGTAGEGIVVFDSATCALFFIAVTRIRPRTIVAKSYLSFSFRRLRRRLFTAPLDAHLLHRLPPDNGATGGFRRGFVRIFCHTSPRRLRRWDSPSGVRPGTQRSRR